MVGTEDELDPATLGLAAVVECSDDAIITEALDGTIRSWNRAAARMFGYTSAQAIGQLIDLIVPPEQRATEREVRHRLEIGQEVTHFETVGLTKDGERLPLSLAMSPLVTKEGRLVGISRIARDLTHQQALERQALRLAAIVNSSEDAIVSKDLNGIVQTWNPAAERLFGYSAEEMIGQSITRILPPDRLAEETDVLARIRDGRSVDHFETIRQRKDGSQVAISLSVSPIRTASGTIIGASKIARDISGQRQLARAAEEASRAKDEFLALLSHELRTPLNAVLGYTRMLRTGELEGPRRDRAIDTIERNAELLSQLVSDVLDVSRIVTGKFTLTMTDCDLRAVVEEAVDVLRPSADVKGVTLHVRQPKTPLMVRCDAARMQQVFWNLLSNAVKFTPPGGRVDLRFASRPSSVDVIVADTGIGIPKAAQRYIFERFWQGTRTRSPLGGLGLGLSLVRHFVELHGGSVRVRSAGPGEGAKFTVSLPRA